MKNRFACFLFTFLCFFSQQAIHAQMTTDTGRIRGCSIMTVPIDSIPLNYTGSIISYVIPAVITTYGVMAIGPNSAIYDRFAAKRDVQTSFPGFYSPADNYLQFVPAAGVFGLSMCGVKGEHNMKEQVILYAASMAVSEGVALGLKYSTRMLRPDNSAYNSFPSGHTSSAFTGAELMNQEYGGRSVWFSIFGYTAASATGYMRMMNNRHWLSDVLVGAGIGMLSTKFVYAVYPTLKKRICGNRIKDAMK